ncbi:hypothetical protein GGI19_000253 [Coemansia pectinata]|uniref:HD domain-containing protein n=1 Tax=Coemansia pectinata TaxID=1052879 RepID=A0A9W8GZT2_9FUNG|nr:hypothetical protein GGI19_000253 [Coemansia pectinata]
MAPEQRVSKVFKLLENVGKEEHISGKMTQLDHALQAAHLAKKEGADEETILAALLYGIGHLVPSKEQLSDTRDKKLTMLPSYDPNNLLIGAHEYNFNAEFGGQHLRQLGFSNKTCELVESNVMAKRYLLTIKSGYALIVDDHPVVVAAHRVSPLSSTEMREFEKDPLFKQKVQLAKWDDAAAKVSGVNPPALDTYHEMVIRNMQL